MKIEKEARYYFSYNNSNNIADKLAKQYKYTHSYHEITTMYDNPNPKMTFYSKDIDGRLRLRYSNTTSVTEFGPAPSRFFDGSQCLVTWKRRIPEGRAGAVITEEEIEYSVSAEEFESVKSIFEDVLQCKRVSSYERTRSFLSAGSIQITYDKFPFGIMVEFELRNSSDEQILLKEITRMGLNHKDASNLSCDDMYNKLCSEQMVKPLSDISFDDQTMPKIN